MPIEIALTNVAVEAGQMASGAGGVDGFGKPLTVPEDPWLLGFKDERTGIAVSVHFTAKKMRDTVEALMLALDGKAQAKKPDLVIARGKLPAAS